MPYFVKQSHRAPAVTEPVPVDESLPRACVIGAGSSGIAAAKALYLAGVPFDCFEARAARRRQLGLRQPQRPLRLLRDPRDQHLLPADGVLRLPDAGGLPALRAARPGRTPTSRRTSTTSASATRITFNTTVQDVSRGDDGRWLVRTTGPDGERSETYDAVLVANGHHWDARWPEPAYPGDFDGEQIHAHDYRSGTSWPAATSSSWAPATRRWTSRSRPSRRARTTTWSVRRTEWVLRKFTLGKPSDQVALPGWLPWWATGVRLRDRRDHVGQHGEVRPAASRSHKPGQSHPVQSERIRDRLGRVAITATAGHRAARRRPRRLRRRHAVRRPT